MNLENGNLPEILKGIEYLASPVEHAKGTIFYCHSFMGTYQYKHSLRKHYANYNYYALNLPGQGKSAYTNEKQFDLDYSIQVLLAFIDYFKLQDMIMIGHSRGGGIVAVLNELIGEKIKMNILEAPASGAMLLNYDVIKVLIPNSISDAKVIVDALYYDAAKTLGSHYDGFIQKQFSEVSNEFGKFRHMLNKAAVIKDGKSFDNGYKKIIRPTLFILGEKDGILPPWQTVNHLKDLNPDFYFEIIPKAGHLVFHEQTNQFLQLSDAFIVKYQGKQ